MTAEGGLFELPLGCGGTLPLVAFIQDESER